MERQGTGEDYYSGHPVSMDIMGGYKHPDEEVPTLAPPYLEDDHPAGPSTHVQPQSSKSSSSKRGGGSGGDAKREEKPTKSKRISSPGGGKKDGDPQGPKRAAQACLRCRKQKLRCLGGYPCNRCTKSKNICDFGRPGFGPSATRDSGSIGSAGGVGGVIESNSRLEQLESSVANLLAGLAGAAPNGQYANTEILHTFGVDRSELRPPRTHSISEQRGHPPWAPPPSSIPPPTHTRPIDPPRIGLNPLQSPLSPDDINRHHVRFSASPGNSFIPHGTSPSAYTSSGFGLTPDENRLGFIKDKKRKSIGDKAEERLAVTESPYEPPFKALLHQPSLWDNREQSRRNSPDRSTSQPQSRDEISGHSYERRLLREKDDPVNTGIVDIHMAETLFQFFVDHCHPFLPIVNVALDDAFNTIRQSPTLISAMLAIAARFFCKLSDRSLRGGLFPLLSRDIPGKLANLAESHLAQTMLRKQHALSDVQAILLLAGWGLQSGGRGPDSWIVTGHAARISRRLGVHKVLAHAAETARVTRPGSEDWEKLEAFMPQWRTWLCWFTFDGFLSLGFGRPQSTQFETVDASGFLQLRLHQPLPRPGSNPSVSLYGDVYIAGQVQLTQIGRDLVNWGEMLADPDKAVFAEPRRAEIFRDTDLSLTNMLRELNSRLDEWSRLWVWTGSPYSLYLGSSARIARLQAEHMRLCLNSYALKADPEEDEEIVQCLKRASNAAMSTIQTHFESSQTDLALSFATDYLTITLAQAAVFLIRITKAPDSIQAVLKIDHSVVAHYLKMSIDLLESSDLSETRLATYLAKTIRDISRAAGIDVSPPMGYDEPESNGARSNTNLSYSVPEGKTTDEVNGVSAGGGGGGNGNGSGNGIGGGSGLGGLGQGFDLENFLQIESQLDLGLLLSLPGDNTPTQGNGTSLNYGSGGYTGEFGFGMGGMGVTGGGGQGMSADF